MYIKIFPSQYPYVWRTRRKVSYNRLHIAMRAEYQMQAVRLQNIIQLSGIKQVIPIFVIISMRKFFSASILGEMAVMRVPFPPCRNKKYRLSFFIRSHPSVITTHSSAYHALFRLSELSFYKIIFRFSAAYKQTDFCLSVI